MDMKNIEWRINIASAVEEKIHHISNSGILYGSFKTGLFHINESHCSYSDIDIIANIFDINKFKNYLLDVLEIKNEIRISVRKKQIHFSGIPESVGCNIAIFEYLYKTGTTDNKDGYYYNYQKLKAILRILYGKNYYDWSLKKIITSKEYINDDIFRKLIDSKMGLMLPTQNDVDYLYNALYFHSDYKKIIPLLERDVKSIQSWYNTASQIIIRYSKELYDDCSLKYSLIENFEI